jgi:hypothetical protein
LLALEGTAGKALQVFIVHFALEADHAEFSPQRVLTDPEWVKHLSHPYVRSAWHWFPLPAMVPFLGAAGGSAEQEFELMTQTG